jgi:ComF family protein
MFLARFLDASLDLALPRECVLCGSSETLKGPPLCETCALSLDKWTGDRCPRCGLPLISEQGLCMRCRGRDWAFDSAYPLYSYSGPVRELISAYKKDGRRSLAPFLAGLLAEAIDARWPERTIVPVPPRPGKIRRRGWDQVEELARQLELRGLTVSRALERLPSEEQKSLGRSGRGENARKAYALKRRASPPPRPLLLDDVVTTCATIDACARALKEGGAVSVVALILAAD